MTNFQSHPIDPSPWDGTILGFGGDVMPGNHIELLQLPGTTFDITKENTVPPMGHMTHLLTSDPMAAMLGPFTLTANDMETMQTHMMVLVPQAYLLTIGLDTNPSPTLGSGGQHHHCRWKGE